ncbi:MAG: beta-galactosidase [Paraglaciecola sp.]
MRLANFDSLRPTLSQDLIECDSGNKYTATLWCESYHLGSATATHTYKDGPMQGMAGVTRKDNVWVIGALSESLISDVVKQQLSRQKIDFSPLPQGVRISRRGSTSLLLNFNQQEVQWQGKSYPGVSFTTL